MILHNAGKYNGDENSLPQREHEPNAVPFKEIDDMKKFSSIINLGGFFIMIILVIPFILTIKTFSTAKILIYSSLCPIWNLVLIIPHELLHAVCFKKDVYFYNNLSNGTAFVIGTEDMSKTKFVLMCLCPNIFLGLIPYIIFFIFPKMEILGLLGLVSLGAGFGDYMNAYNSIKQMPKGAKTYLCGMHSYWYIKK